MAEEHIRTEAEWAEKLGFESLTIKVETPPLPFAPRYKTHLYLRPYDFVLWGSVPLSGRHRDAPSTCSLARIQTLKVRGKGNDIDAVLDPEGLSSRIVRPLYERDPSLKDQDIVLLVSASTSMGWPLIELLLNKALSFYEPDRLDKVLAHLGLMRTEGDPIAGRIMTDRTFTSLGFERFFDSNYYALTLKVEETPSSFRRSRYDVLRSTSESI